MTVPGTAPSASVIRPAAAVRLTTPQTAWPARLPAAPQSEKPLSTAAPVPAPLVAAASATAELESQLGALRDQVKQLQADNGTLQAKLKEAMAAQPTAVDPREVARIQEQLRSLMKENDLLKASLAQGHGVGAVA